MTDLRQAAQQALEALENGKRVRDGEGGTKYQPPLEDSAIAALRDVLAQPEQEPVAFAYYWPPTNTLRRNQAYQLQWGPTTVWKDDVPLYTHPPRREWQSLTEEEILLMSVECAASHQLDDVSFARAIEQALRIKNA